MLALSNLDEGSLVVVTRRNFRPLKPSLVARCSLLVALAREKRTDKRCVFQELMELLRSEVDTVLYKVSEAENMASAVREDLSPEIAALEDSVERCTMKKKGVVLLYSAASRVRSSCIDGVASSPRCRAGRRVRPLFSNLECSLQ